MPLNRYVVRVDPQGKTMDVDVLDTSGSSVPTFESSQFGAAARSLPLTISSPTDFWLQSPGPYDVSCKAGGTEVATASGPARVQVSDVPVLVVPPWEVLAPSGGSGAAGAQIVRAFPVTFDMPNLVTGHTVYTPTAGDLLLDAWLEITTPWDGTTPQGDIGNFTESAVGLFNNRAGTLDMTAQAVPGGAWGDVSAGSLAVLTQALTIYETAQTTQIANAPPTTLQLQNNVPFTVVQTVPGRFAAGLPFKICVSTTGRTDGADPGATQGEATLYLVTATPVTA